MATTTARVDPWVAILLIEISWNGREGPASRQTFAQWVKVLVRPALYTGIIQRIYRLLEKRLTNRVTAVLARFRFGLYRVNKQGLRLTSERACSFFRLEQAKNGTNVRWCHQPSGHFVQRKSLGFPGTNH